jgi:hypothetical protein
MGPWDLEWHTAAEHPGGTATYELLRPYPNQRQRGRVPAQRAAGELTLPVVGRWCVLVLLEDLVLTLVVVDDPEDLDEAECGSQPTQGRLLVRVELGHDSSRLPPRRLVAPGPEVQVHPAAMELELVDLALAVVLAAGLEDEDLQVARQVLELGQQFSYRHSSLLCQAAGS